MKPKVFALGGLVLGASVLANSVVVGADSYSPESMFNLVDHNRDGNISRPEWKQFIRTAASAFSANGAACFTSSRVREFGVLDRNHDGKISWREWQVAGRRRFDPAMPDCS